MMPPNKNKSHGLDTPSFNAPLSFLRFLFSPEARTGNTSCREANGKCYCQSYMSTGPKQGLTGAKRLHLQQKCTCARKKSLVGRDEVIDRPQ